MPDSGTPLEGSSLTEAISAAMVALYGKVYGHDRTRATSYVNDDVVVCILEDILSHDETQLVDAGGSEEVLDGRVAFQADTEDEFTAAVEHLTQRRVVAFMSANQTARGVASELFFLEPRGADPRDRVERSA